MPCHKVGSVSCCPWRVLSCKGHYDQVWELFGERSQCRSTCFLTIFAQSSLCLFSAASPERKMHLIYSQWCLFSVLSGMPLLLAEFLFQVLIPKCVLCFSCLCTFSCNLSSLRLLMLPKCNYMFSFAPLLITMLTCLSKMLICTVSGGTTTVL